jgi:uncharacterized protein (DUF983 family)
MRKTITRPKQSILLHACPRCRGDLFPDFDDVAIYACLQCGRRIPTAALERSEPKVLAPAA